MTETAGLEINVKATGVKSATDDLKKLAGASESAERATEGLGDSFTDAAKAAGVYADKAGRLREANGRFLSDARKTELGLDKLGDKFKTTGGAAESFGRNVGRLAAAFAGGAFFKAVIANTIESENALAQLNATIESTGGAAGVTSEEMVAMAQGLQAVTTYGDDAIISMQSQLLTFTKISKDAVPQATEAILDLATKMGGDLKGAAVQVGKALNDPVAGISALSKVGVSFTEDQKAVIKSLVDTGNVAGAQKIILAELAVEFGGSARAARDTFGGALTSLQNSLGDLLEGGGGNLSDAKTAVEELNAAISDPAVKEAFATITAGMLNVAAAAANALPELVSFSKWAAESLGLAAREGTSQLVYLSDEITKIDGLLKAREGQSGLSSWFSSGSTEAMKTQLAGLNVQYAEALDFEEQRAIAAADDLKIKNQLVPVVATVADGIKTKTAADKSAASASSAAASAAASHAKALGDQISALEFQASVVGKDKDEVTLLKLALDGATESQLASAQAALGTVAAYEKQADAAETAKKQAEQSKTFADALEEQIIARRNAIKVEVQSISIGEQQAEMLRELSELEFEYAERIRALAGAQGTTTELTSDEYNKRLELLKKAKQAEIDLILDGEKQKADAAKSAGAGAKKAVSDYLAEAADIAKQTEEIVGGALQGLEDQLFNLVKTGKADFKSLVTSISDDITRMGLKQLIAGGFGAITGLGGAGGGGGGGVDFAGLATKFAGMFDSGGNIPAGKFGIAGENGAEIVKGPAQVTSTKDTAKMMGGNTIIINQPGVSSTREAERSAGATRRAVMGAVNSGSRYA